MAWTNTGGGDHGGADWTISINTTVGGNHTNVGIFTINGGITATVSSTVMSFKVLCIKAVVNGSINGSSSGYSGGIAGSGSASVGSAGGSGSGTGGGACGKGGAHGGNGGFGGLYKAGKSGHSCSCGLHSGTGTVGIDGAGNASADGNNTNIYGSITDTSVYSGSGGGGSSGGSGSGIYEWFGCSDCNGPYWDTTRNAGSNGSVGGSGGGSIYIEAKHSIYIVTATVNGSNATGTGGNGGKERYNAAACESAKGGEGGPGGGGGGGSGGSILLYAPKVTYTTLTSIGGNGTAGGYYKNFQGTIDQPTDNGGGGGSGGRIKIFTARPTTTYLSSGTATYSGGTKGSSSIAVDGASGTYATGATSPATADVPFEARKIYQASGAYKKRFRVSGLL